MDFGQSEVNSNLILKKEKEETENKKISHSVSVNDPWQLIIRS